MKAIEKSIIYRYSVHRIEIVGPWGFKDGRGELEGNGEMDLPGPG